MTRRADTKRAILERRAILLGSALAGLGGCDRSGPPAASAEPVVTVPSETEPAGGAPVDAPDGGAPKRRPVAVDGDMPPLDVPDGVTPEARERFETLARVMTEAHQSIREIEEAVPSCGVSSCDAEWKALAKKVYDLDGHFRFFYVCPGSSESAKLYMARHEAHYKYYEARRAAMDAKIRAELPTEGDKLRWDAMIDEVRMANPVPCLSFACMDW